MHDLYNNMTHANDVPDEMYSRIVEGYARIGWGYVRTLKSKEFGDYITFFKRDPSHAEMGFTDTLWLLLHVDNTNLNELLLKTLTDDYRYEYSLMEQYVSRTDDQSYMRKSLTWVGLDSYLKSVTKMRYNHEMEVIISPSPDEDEYLQNRMYILHNQKIVNLLHEPGFYIQSSVPLDNMGNLLDIELDLLLEDVFESSHTPDNLLLRAKFDLEHAIRSI